MTENERYLSVKRARIRVYSLIADWRYETRSSSAKLCARKVNRRLRAIAATEISLGYFSRFLAASVDPSDSPIP